MRVSQAILVLCVGPVNAFLPSGNLSNKLSTLSIATTDDNIQLTTTDDNIQLSTTDEKLYKETVYTFVTDIFSADSASPITREFGEKSQALPFVSRPINLAGYVGDAGFDPLGFSDRFSMEYLREAELKHGRLGSLAWLGWIGVDLGMRINLAPAGELQASNSAAALKALLPKAALASHPDGFWNSPTLKALFLISFIECVCTDDVAKMINRNECPREAGDLNFDVLKILKGKSDAEIEKMKLHEIKNVRLGMLAFFGVLIQSTVLGHDAFPYVGSDFLDKAFLK